MSKAVVYNKSKTYLLPLLSELIEFDERFIDNLENTFMYVDTNEYENCLLVLHDYAFEHADFAEYEATLASSELFVDSVDIGNKILFIFKFPEEYLHEYKCLEKGRYSHYGIDAKELILKFWNRMYRKRTGAIPILLKIKQILFKDEKLKKQLEKDLSSPRHIVKIDDDAELGSLINKEDETFELSEYKKK